MNDPFVLAFVEKLALLEERTGSRIDGRLMAPRVPAEFDAISIQKLAKDIAAFLGLTGYTFIVGTAKQKEHVGGHIELTSADREVFIEIDDDSKRFPGIIGATLCHEICHKWLHVLGIRLPIERENEILTDLAAVYGGLGKFMLNGCQGTHERRAAVPGGVQTITQTKTVGYLDRDQLAFAYAMVCAMRHVSEVEMFADLNKEAENSVSVSRRNYGRYFAADFHRPSKNEELAGGFQKKVFDVQRELVEIDKHVAYVRESFGRVSTQYLQNAASRLVVLHGRVESVAKESESTPNLRFLGAIRRDLRVEAWAAELPEIVREGAAYHRHAKFLVRHLFRNRALFPIPEPDAFRVVACPRDGTKMRLPENSGDLIATCPVCRYRFAHNTSVPTCEEPPVPPPQTSRFRRLWNRWFGKAPASERRAEAQQERKDE